MSIDAQVSADSRTFTLAKNVLVVLAVGGALGFAVVLGVRPIQSNDLGYHLAYGDAFRDEGRIVDHNEFLYTLRRYRETDVRDDAGPGCWYDRQGRYRFPNANWFSQVIMSGVYRVSGGDGLCFLRLTLVVGIFSLSLLTLRNLKVPWIWGALGILLIAMVSYQRFALRPELFAYLLLSGQLCILTRRGAREGPDRWKLSPADMVGLILLHLLLVNMHSYFLLSLGLTGAVLVDRAVCLWWKRARGEERDTDSAPARRVVVRLLIVFAVQVLLCFANPWTWRVAVLPFQTLVFIRKHDITGGDSRIHPWAGIPEIYRPFGAVPLLPSKATYAFYVLLGFAGLGAAAALVRRRWSDALIVAGMTGVSLSMVRNIPLGAMMIVPIALCSITWFAERIAGGMERKTRDTITAAGAVLILLCSGALVFSVVTNRFYAEERMFARFSVGFDDTYLSRHAADWMNRHKPTGRIWTDFNTSSNIHYFVSPRPAVPIITNTWAYPPEVMREVTDYGDAVPGFQSALDRYAPEILVLRLDCSGKLIHTLVRDAKWSPVCIDWTTLVLLRSDGLNARLAREAKITEDADDLEGYLRDIERADPAPGHRLFGVGVMMVTLGWESGALQTLHRAIDHDPRHAEALTLLGRTYLKRGRRKRAANDPDCISDFSNAQKHFRKAHSVSLGFKDPADGLQEAGVQLREALRTFALRDGT